MIYSFAHAALLVSNPHVRLKIPIRSNSQKTLRQQPTLPNPAKARLSSESGTIYKEFNTRWAA